MRTYEEVKQAIEARFGDSLPKHFKKRLSRPQQQPYCDGDSINVLYARKDKRFNAPYAVPCEVTRESCRKFKDTYLLGDLCADGTDEPFPWADHKYQVTLNFLRSLPDGAKLLVQTRSDLIAHDDYIAELKRLNVKITMLYLTTDEDVSRLVEPGAPSYKRRKHAVKKLKSAGLIARLRKVTS